MSNPEEWQQRQELYVEWRHYLHQNPELAFEEVRTADFIAERLREAGIEVHTGIGGTGVVGVLRNGIGKRRIGFRADMDALPMTETGAVNHRSLHEGKFHGCGHDGHTVMLLAAAQQLAAKPEFNGTLYFIFQPAEEGKGGAEAMILDGLFERFPMDSVFGLHNSPGMAAGRFGVRSGPMLAAYESFDIVVSGIGGHGAMPHECVDSILTGSHIVVALQSIIARNLDPARSGVVSVTRIEGGSAYNVIPGQVRLGGAIRYFEVAEGQLIRQRVLDIANGTAKTFGAAAEITFNSPSYPPLLNDPGCTEVAIHAASSVVGADQVNSEVPLIMGSDDFAAMLQQVPGCYLLIGNGLGAKGGCMVHHPEYDFNDEILPLGIRYWMKLAEQSLC